MKNMNKIVVLLALSGILFWNVSAATIDKIDAISNSTIELEASQDVIFSDVKVNWDVKLLKDIPVSLSIKDSEDMKKVVINLLGDLYANTSYSLISILWANWNIDFTIWEFLEWEIVNPNLVEGEEWIVKVNIIDSRTMELYFTSDLTEETFEFKILSEVWTSWLKSEGNNKLQLEVASALENKTNYIVMIISLEDATGTAIKFDEDLYDYQTPETLIAAIPEEVKVIAEPATEPEVVVEEWNIEEVALNAPDTTPATGAETSILILLALFANLAFFLRKKFVK